MNKRKFLAAVTALVITACLAGCSNKNKTEDSSSNTDQNSSLSDSSLNDKESSSVSDSSLSDNSSQTESNVQGEHIKKAYEFFTQKNYSFKERITDENGDVSTLAITVRGEDFCQQQENSLGKYGAVKIGGEAYKFDYACEIYEKADLTAPENLIKATVENNLPKTETHIKEEDMKKYDVEEYTYTGATYITVLDFCFDKKTGKLVKYNVNYLIEGKDDVTQVREIYDMSDKADEALLNAAPIKAMTNFGELNEDARASYCQMIIDAKNISSDNVVTMGMTTDKLKTIAFDEFVDFIYSYVNK